MKDNSGRPAGLDKTRSETLAASEAMLSYCHAARWEALYEASRRQLQLLKDYSELAVSRAERDQLRKDLLEITANNRRVSDLAQDYRCSISQSLLRRKQGSAMQRLTREIQRFQ